MYRHKKTKTVKKYKAQLAFVVCTKSSSRASNNSRTGWLEKEPCRWAYSKLKKKIKKMA